MGTVATVVSLAIGVITFIGGLLAWYRGAVEKRYAAERDFNHLKRNYEQLANSLGSLMKDEEDRFDELRLELRELKFQLQGIPPKSIP